MPQFGDYWTGVRLGVLAVQGAALGCIGVAGGSELIAKILRLTVSLSPGVMCALGGLMGGLYAIADYLTAAYDEYYRDFSQWCRQNYTDCKRNEYYLKACSEIIKPQ